MTERSEPTDYREFLDEQAADFGEAVPEVEDVLGPEEPQAKGASDDQEDPSLLPSHRAKLEGTDVVLRRLESRDPGAAALMREMQSRMSRNINEWNTLRADVLDLREELLAQRAEKSAAAATTEEDMRIGLPEGVTEEHLNLFRAMADHLGYVPKEELERRDIEGTSASYVQQELQRGVDLYGEDFGTVNSNGQVGLSPEVQERLRDRLATLEDPNRGLTPLDLFRLEFPELAIQRSKRSTAEEHLQRGPKRERGTVIRRSFSGNNPVAIYDPKRGDSSDDVFERAYSLARRELTR